MNINRKLQAVIAAVALSVPTSVLVAVTAHSADTTDPRTAPVPVLELDQDAQQKAIVSTWAFQAGAPAQQQSATVIAGRGPELIGNPHQLHVAVNNREGSAVVQFDEADPLTSGVHEANGQHHHDVAPSATGSFIFPFDPRAADVVVTRADNGQAVGQGSLAQAVRDFCQQHTADHDCATDLSVTLSDAPDPVAAGAQVEYTARVTNNGPSPAQAVRVVDTLPNGTTFYSGSTGCSASGAVVTCEVGYLAAGGTAQVSVKAAVAADLVYKNGGPLAVVAEAVVSNLAGDDPVSGNNGAKESTRVVAVSDLAVTGVQPVSPPTQTIIGQPVPVTVATTTTNHGPSAPTDESLSVSATADPGLTVTPASAVVPQAALGLEERRQASSTFSLACSEPGAHTVKVASTVSPAHVADTDPNPANNTAGAEFTVDCVVPVALNIKPGSTPNSVNPGDKGVVPVAILTTRAGEYGLPLAFDATTIQADTVRFGPRGSAFAGVGATEAHGKIHTEDSYELDERTRDGDQDAVMHFPTPDSGISPGTREACVWGKFVAANGKRYTFFGCDSVQTVPR